MLYGERPLKIAGKEFDLLVLFLRNPGRVLSLGYLLESVWGAKAPMISRALDTHIYQLRKKLFCLTPKYGWQLTAVYGHGYRLARIDAALMNFPPNGPIAVLSSSHPESSPGCERVPKSHAQRNIHAG